MFKMIDRCRDYVIGNGRIFCIDTVNTFDCGWETMVGEIEDYDNLFITVITSDWDGEDEDYITEILDDMDYVWDLFDMTRRYKNKRDAVSGHCEIVNKLEEIFG